MLGFSASAAASCAVGGGTKRARAVDVGGSGEPSSERRMKTGGHGDEEDMDVDTLAARMTIVLRRPRRHHVHRYVLGPVRAALILV